jgi:hypothetical protein
MGGTCCTAYCDTSAPNSCGGALSCQPLFEQGEAPPELATVGVCALAGWRSIAPSGVWTGF